MSRPVRLLVAIVMCMATVLSARPVAAQSGDVGPTLDLAAIVVPPSALDIPERGERFGVSSTAPLSFDSYFKREFGSDAVGSEVEDQFRETGWLGAYLHQYAVLASADQGDIIRGYQIEVSQFEDADGAEAAFELMDLDTERVDTDIEVGDSSYLVNVTTPAGGPITEDLPTSKLVFLADDVIAAIRILDVATGELADQKEFEPVAEAFLERIEAVQDGDAPGLGSLVQPVEFEEQIALTANYLRLDGATIQRTVETEQEAASLVTKEAEHVYFHQQRGSSPEEGEGDSVWFYIVYLFAFDDEDGATAFLDDAEDYLAGTPRVEQAETIQSDGRIGDGSTALQLSGVTSAGNGFHATSVFTRVGATVARVQVNSTSGEAPPLAAVEALAEAQAGCLEAGECADIISVTDLPTEDDAGGDTDADERVAVDGEVYESPQYGYTLTFDPADWSVSSEDDDPDDAYDRVTLEHELGFVSVIGDPDYRPRQLDDCVADYEAGLEQGDGVDNVRAIRGEAGEEDDRAWAAFTYDLLVDDDTEPLEVARYIECRADAEVTVVILQTSLEADYDDLSAARAELLESIG